MKARLIKELDGLTVGDIYEINMFGFDDGLNVTIKGNSEFYVFDHLEPEVQDDKAVVDYFELLPATS